MATSMRTGRRSTVAAEAERRSREHATRLGGQVREMRLRRGLSQRALGERVGLGRMIVGRLERADGPLDLQTLERIAIGLDVSLSVGLGRDRLETVADAGHLAVQELVLRLGRARGLRRAIELPTRPGEPWRSIDVVLASDARHLAICAECWNSIGDVGAALRASNRKAAELDAIATGRWGEEARSGLVWVVRATARNRDLVGRYPEVFAAGFPGSSRAWVEALTSGAKPPAEPGLVWCDVSATRLFEWRQR